MFPFRSPLSLPGFSNDELLPSWLSHFSPLPVSHSGAKPQGCPPSPSLNKVPSSSSCLCVPFHSRPSWGPCFCSSTTLRWLSRCHCCRHLQPLFCYPTALIVSICWPPWHGLSLNGRPSLPPTVSDMHLTLQSNCSSCLNSQVLTSIDFAYDWIAPLPLGLLKVSLSLKAQLKCHHLLEVSFDNLTEKDALCSSLLSTCWLIFTYW